MIHRIVLSTLIASVVVSTAHAVEIEGFTEPYRSINVAAVESGIVINLLVQEGAKVTRHQPLAALNQDVLKATLDIAKTQRDATSALKSAESELKLRADRLAKLQQLRDRGVASEEEVFRATLEAEIAEAHLTSAKETVEIKALDYERIRLQLEHRTVKSPIDGFVTQIFREVGEFVAPTDPVVMTVVQLDPLAVTFPVPASHAFTLRAGQTLPLRIEGDNRPASAKVEFVSPVVNAETQTVRVRVLLSNSSLKHRSGAKTYLDIPGTGPKSNLNNGKSVERVSSKPLETERE
jgi:RND family efflux transporter MFP subunit